MVQRVLTNIAVTENVQKSKVKKKRKKKKKSEPVAITETIANKDDIVRTV